MSRDTMSRDYAALMGCPSVRLDHCAICGRPRPLNQHHMVPRSAGEIHDEGGMAREKPTITLCGLGNHLTDADGRPLCHGLAHHHLLHFRWDGCALWYLRTDRPTPYREALALDGWRRVRCR